MPTRADASATHSGVATVRQSSLNDASVSVRHAWRVARMADSTAVAVAMFRVRKAFINSASVAAMYGGTRIIRRANGREDTGANRVSSSGLYLK